MCPAVPPPSFYESPGLEMQSEQKEKTGMGLQIRASIGTHIYIYFYKRMDVQNSWKFPFFPIHVTLFRALHYRTNAAFSSDAHRFSRIAPSGFSFLCLHFGKIKILRIKVCIFPGQQRGQAGLNRVRPRVLFAGSCNDRPRLFYDNNALRSCRRFQPPHFGIAPVFFDRRALFRLSRKIPALLKEKRASINSMPVSRDARNMF